MDSRFTNIKVLIWDFDGTFYSPHPDLFKAVRQAEYRTIVRHTGWPMEKVIAEFEKLHKVVLPSATETVAVLAHIKVSDAAVEMEEYFDRRDFLKRDEKLIKMFTKLTSYRHMILANGVIKKHHETLKLLGISENIFELFVTSETVGATKPDPAGFNYILKYTGLPPAEHFMIGDRELVDLLPAKTLGMKTCLVWSDKPGKYADVTLPDVYKVADLFN